MSTLSASDFKAKCLDVLDRVGDREVESVSITKHGKVVAMLVPPTGFSESVQALHGCMPGSVLIPEGVDLTAPTFEGESVAESGQLHL